MPRLIDADALEKTGIPFTTHGGATFIALGSVRTAPTIEAEPVRHGRWVYHECVSSHDGAISGYSCSKCNAFVDEEIFDMDEFHKDFCGHCGAKMDGDEK